MTPGDWLSAFEHAVRARDYARGRELVASNVMSFGTLAPRTLRSVSALVEEQWRPIWETTEDFQFESPKIFVDGAQATIAAEWSSVRTRGRWPRRGRATIVLRFAGDSWVAVHTHFSMVPP